MCEHIDLKVTQSNKSVNTMWNLVIMIPLYLPTKNHPDNSDRTPREPQETQR